MPSGMYAANVGVKVTYIAGVGESFASPREADGLFKGDKVLVGGFIGS